MRLLAWTAATWAVLFLAIIAIDVSHTVATGADASQAVVQEIDGREDDTGLLGWMERVSRDLDAVGHTVFGTFAPLFELGFYGLLAPLFIAIPVGCEARRRSWPPRPGIGIAGFSVLLIALWALSKPALPDIYYALVNALLLCCQAIGLSYYQGSLVYFIILPPTCLLAYVGYRLAWVDLYNGLHTPSSR